MKKILVPLDFTPASKNAFSYAIQLAKVLKVEIHVLHVVFPTANTGTYPIEAFDYAPQNQKTSAKNKLKKLTTFYPNKDADELIKHNVSIQYWIKEGLAVSTIIATAKTLSIDLILVGAKERTQIGNFLLGSVTVELITQTALPVLVVPTNFSYQPINNIAYSTELKGKDKHVFGQLQALANHFKANLHPFFINQLASDISNKIEEKWTSDSLLEEKEFTAVTIIRAPIISNGIHYFLEQYPTQLLAMFIPKRKFLKQLFHISVTQKMVAQTNIPLLIYRG